MIESWVVVSVVNLEKNVPALKANGVPSKKRPVKPL